MHIHPKAWLLDFCKVELWCVPQPPEILALPTCFLQSAASSMSSSSAPMATYTPQIHNTISLCWQKHGMHHIYQFNIPLEDVVH